MVTLDAGHPQRAAAHLRPVVVREITAAEHAGFAQAGSHSFLQTPAWAGVKPGWRSQSLGWFHERAMVGSALVLYRAVPGTRRSLAYVPEGPCLPWQQVSTAPSAWLDPFIAHLRGEGAFAVRIGPQQVLREWLPATVKRGLANPQIRRFADLPATSERPAGHCLEATLRAGGWRCLDEDGDDSAGFGAGQPRFTVRIPLSERTEQDLLAGVNQQWRRNVNRAERAGVVVREGSCDDLGTFHRLYAETASRDGFTPRPASYFTGMWDALARDGGPTSAHTPGPSMRLYVAEIGAGGDADPAAYGEAPEPPLALAAALMIRSGDVCWYVYGASTAEHREAQAPTALQWQAIRDARVQGCTGYDLRGIAGTLDAQEQISGLLRFKLNTGGVVTQTSGEWELVLSTMWHKAFQTYLRIRS